jgi:hypothetical protein
MHPSARNTFLAIAGALLALGAGTAGATRGPATATLEACHRDATQTERFVTFGAEMRAVPGTARMAVRFDLQRKREGGRYRAVRPAGWGRWLRSDPGVDIFRYRKQVTNLSAPARYRAVVRYRWYAASGRVLRRAHRATPACRQTDPRPDLVVLDVALQDGPASDRARYLVTVRNRGRRAAGAFDAILFLDGVREGSVTVPDLAGRAEHQVAIEGRRCGVGSRVRVVVDAGGTVEESREENNDARLACPL